MALDTFLNQFNAVCGCQESLGRQQTFQRQKVKTDLPTLPRQCTHSLKRSENAILRLDEDVISTLAECRAEMT